MENWISVKFIQSPLFFPSKNSILFAVRVFSMDV